MQSESFNSSTTDADQLLEAGIAVAKAGDLKRARKLLKKSIRLDQHNIQAWLWLSGVVDDLEQRETCLAKILAIDPEHKAAQKGLRSLQKKKVASGPSPLKTLTSPETHPTLDEVDSNQAEPPATSRYRRLASAVADRSDPPALDQDSQTTPQISASRYKKLSPNQAPQAVAAPESSANGRQACEERSPEPAVVSKEPAPVPIISPAKVEDIFSNEYLCPYCAAPNRYEDQTCGACDHKLWQETLRRRETSGLFRFLLWSHIISNIIYISLALTMIRAALDNHFISAGQAVTILALFVPSVIYFVVVLVILHRRMKIFFKVYLIQAILFFGLSTAVAAGVGFTAVPFLIKFFSAGLAVLSIGQFFMALNLGEDFTYDRNRIRLLPESEDGTPLGFMKQGKFYAKQKMWAMAAVYFRQAAYRLSKNIEPRLSLVVAYINLKKFEHAAHSLAIAKKINPHDPRIAKLSTLIAKRQK